MVVKRMEGNIIVYPGIKLAERWWEQYLYYSVEVHSYPDFNNENITLSSRDIALIKLNKPINTSANGLFAIENNICLPPQRESTALESDPEYAITAGWAFVPKDRLQLMYLK